jgi:hypothetical protein
LDDSVFSVSNRLYYTLIDKSLDNGRGDVVDKNVIIVEDTMAIQQLSANRHGNGRDWWIIVPEFATNLHYVYLLSPSGIELVSTQRIGTILNDDDSGGNAIFTPDGSKYIRV